MGPRQGYTNETNTPRIFYWLITFPFFLPHHTSEKRTYIANDSRKVHLSWFFFHRQRFVNVVNMQTATRSSIFVLIIATIRFFLFVSQPVNFTFLITKRRLYATVSVSVEKCNPLAWILQVSDYLTAANKPILMVTRFLMFYILYVSENLPKYIRKSSMFPFLGIFSRISDQFFESSSHES